MAEEQKKKNSYFHGKRGLIRIIALVVALLMIFAMCASVIFYLTYNH